MHHRSMRQLTTAILIGALMMAMFAPSASAAISAKVNSSSAKVYQTASTDANSVKVSKNLQVSVTAVSGSWAKVSYKGKTAYMRLSDLTPTKRATGYVTKSASVYNSSGKKISTVSEGASLYVLGTVSGYYCVTNKSGSMGFVKKDAISDKKPAGAAASKPSVTDTVERSLPKESKESSVSEKPATQVEKKASGVELAIQVGTALQGTPYSLGDPSKGFNCSSFVRYCMGKAGYSMKGTAAAQAADGRYEKITSVSSLKRGDVLFFDTSEDGTVDHTAIYLGGNRFIEASQKAGCVQNNTLSSWYKSHFVCARRPA